MRGQGRVIPSSQLQVVSNLEGGVVQDILVRSGQQVRAGDVLIRLDRTQTGAEFGSGEATLIGAEHQDRPAGGRDQRPRAGLSRRAPIPAIADQIRIEQALHASRMADLAGDHRRRHAPGSARPSARSPRPRPPIRRAPPPTSSAASEARLIRPAGRARHRAAAQPGPGREPPPISRAARWRRPAQAVARARSAASPRRARRSPRPQQEWRAQAGDRARHRPGRTAARRARAARARRPRCSAPCCARRSSGRINRVLVTTRGGSVRAGEPVVEIVPSRREPADRGAGHARRTSPSCGSASMPGSRSPPMTARSTACSKAASSASRPTRWSRSGPARASTRSGSAPTDNALRDPRRPADADRRRHGRRGRPARRQAHHPPIYPVADHPARRNRASGAIRDALVPAESSVGLGGSGDMRMVDRAGFEPAYVETGRFTVCCL